MLDGVLAAPVRDVRELEALQPLLVRNSVGLSRGEESDLMAQVHGKVAECLRYQAQALAGGGAAPEGDFLVWCRARQQALGSTALCLSGGGSLAMYHMGLVRFLLEEGLLPKVISAASGGSIVAAFCALFSDEELLDSKFVEDISTRYEERWFPPLSTEVLNFAKHGALVRTEDFERTTLRYFGTATFAEAFARTGRHVSIAISSSFYGRLPGPVLLNHLTAPQVLISSAVATSCTAPGIMVPRGLMKKAADGAVVPFDLIGEKFLDGSLTAELPKNQLRSWFQVNQFIVSQVNPHIAPFLRGEGRLHKLQAYFGRCLQQRCRYLSASGMLPMFFGKSTGLITHLGQNFGALDTADTVTVYPDSISFLSIKQAVLNPSRADMRRYLLDGQRMGWAKAGPIRTLLAVERALEHAADSAAPRAAPRRRTVRGRQSAPAREGAARRSRSCSEQS